MITISRLRGYQVSVCILRWSVQNIVFSECAGANEKRFLEATGDRDKALEGQETSYDKKIQPKVKIIFRDLS